MCPEIFLKYRSHPSGRVAVDRVIGQYLKAKETRREEEREQGEWEREQEEGREGGERKKKKEKKCSSLPIAFSLDDVS